MSHKDKQSFMLLKSIIFHYHGLDEDEERMLNESAEELNAQKELQWATEFIASDYISAFERTRAYMSEVMPTIDKEKRLNFINLTWKANKLKGYITEMEVTALLKLAKDWEVKKELTQIVEKEMDL